MSKPIEKRIHEILEEPFWLHTLDAANTYSRQHDDTDGKNEGFLNVMFTKDGDAWIAIDVRNFLRFRMPLDGGGRSPRTRNALLILAEAIRLDNEESNTEVKTV